MKTDRRGFKHGHSGSPEHNSWTEMNKRCNSAASSRFAYYGGRGINICDRWAKFENFLTDMGQKPSPAHTLDRIDPEGHYTPENCRWATRKLQSRNKRNTTFTPHQGQMIPLADYYDLEPRNIPYVTFRLRVRSGWEIERAITTPRMWRGGAVTAARKEGSANV